MLTSLIASFVVGISMPALQKDFSKFEPYVGYHWSAAASRKRAPGVGTRDKLWSLGAHYRYSEIFDNGYSAAYLMFWPELSMGPRLVSLAFGVGPETEFFIGPHHNPVFIFAGAQAGFHYGYIWDDGSFPAKITENEDGTFSTRPYSSADRNTIASVLNVYFGPRMSFGSEYSLKIQMMSQILVGKIAANTTNTTFNDNVGWLLGVNSQFLF